MRSAARPARRISSAKSETAGPASVAAVVVTYNRLPLLKECVAALRAQTRRVDEIVWQG